MIEIPVVFYRSPTGVEPVRDWLRGLPEGDRRAIGADLALVQVGWPIGMPLCRPLSGGLWEVHGFIKKTQKTPPGDLELARKRMQEMKA